MKLFIAGGVGEHGRNCFYVQGEGICFLMDCGTMPETPQNPYPRLTTQQIQNLDAVFLSHSHGDHAGALPWLYENGFHGDVIATDTTFCQLSFPVPNKYTIDEICPNGAGQYKQLSIIWGRSGHCAGSVWYRFSEKGTSILFSGDYIENTQVYICDKIRKQQADLAILDCAYGTSTITYTMACDKIIQETTRLLAKHKLMLFTVPKYGRGLEILKILSKHFTDIPFYADEQFLLTIREQAANNFWYQSKKINASVQKYKDQAQGIIFICDPQMREQATQNAAKKVISQGGITIMTGTPEKGSYSDNLMQQNKMVLLRYPTHLNYTSIQKINAQNSFTKTIPYHSKEFTASSRIKF